MLDKIFNFLTKGVPLPIVVLFAIITGILGWEHGRVNALDSERIIYERRFTAVETKLELFGEMGANLDAVTTKVGETRTLVDTMLADIEDLEDDVDEIMRGL